MHYAILYLDKERRLRIFAEGGYNRERYVYDPLAPTKATREIGWCLEADDVEPWPDEVEALQALATRALACAARPVPIERENRVQVYDPATGTYRDGAAVEVREAPKPVAPGVVCKCEDPKAWCPAHGRPPMPGGR